MLYSLLILRGAGDDHNRTPGVGHQRLADAAGHNAGEQAPSFIINTARHSWLLSLNGPGAARMTESEHSPAWNTLDVAMAHRLVVEEILGVSAADVTAGTHIRYTHDTQEALQAIQEGAAQVVILLNPTAAHQVRDVALADDRMPQKTTYLYPKLATGLVLNPLW